MHITIDTNNITDADRAILALVLGGATAGDRQEQAAYEQAKGTEIIQPDKPARTRRTKLEIAFDTAKEAHDADPTELAALVSAAEELKAKDPGNDRLKDFNPDDYQPTPASEDAEVQISIDEVTELATKLIASDRAAMVEILKEQGVKRVSEVPEADLGEFATKIRAALGEH